MANRSKPIFEGQRVTYHPKPPSSMQRASDRLSLRVPIARQHARDALAGTGLFEDSGPVVKGQTEPYPSFLGRLMQAAGFGVTLAHGVGLESLGFDGSHFARTSAYKMHLLLHLDTVKFKSDPRPTRGDWNKKDASPKEFWNSGPEVALTIGILRSLQFIGDFKPTDLALLWTLVGHAFTHGTDLDLAGLNRRFGFTRTSSALKRLRNGKFSLRDEPSITKNKWCADEYILTESVGTWTVNPKLLDLARPIRGGTRYAYLELNLLRRFGACWQEAAYRSFLAAALRASIYWSKGGTCSWQLTPPQAQEIFSTADTQIKVLRNSRINPFLKILVKSRSRVQLIHCSIARSKEARGRPANIIDVFFEITQAEEKFKPSSGVYLQRTIARSDRGISECVEIVGTGRTDPDALHKIRSNAATLGHKRRREKLKPVHGHLVDEAKLVASKKSLDEMSIDELFKMLMEDDAPPPAIEVPQYLHRPQRPSRSEVARALLTYSGEFLGESPVDQLEKAVLAIDEHDLEIPYMI